MKTTSRTQLVLVAAWLLALALNLTFAVMRPGGSPDTERYDRIGWNLAQSNGYSASAQPPYQPDLLRAPLYPGFLALVFRCCGHSLTAARVAQALLLSLLVPLGWLIGRECFDHRVGMATAWLAALYPYYWLYSGNILSDGPAAVVVAVAAVALIRSLHDQRLAWALLAGLAGGLMCLIKPVLLLFPVAALAAYVVAARPPRGSAMGRWGVYVLAFCLTILPWTIRNYMVSGAFVPVTAGKGLLVYQAARYAESGFSMAEYHANIQAQDPRIQLAQTTDDPVLSLELDRDLTREAMAIIRSRPATYLGSIAANPVLVWLNRWRFAHDHLVLSREHLIISSGYLLSALLGFVLRRDRWRRAIVPVAFIVYISLVHAPLWTEPRQSLPGRLFLLMFSGACIVALAGYIGRRLRNRLRSAPLQADESTPETPGSTAADLGGGFRSCYTKHGMSYPDSPKRGPVAGVADEEGRGA
jgi:4-amino-4-deoxy-L-arabinose transferase-like glycosyltransferase